MRIKAVCEATGLTDRTIRYYIEEGLLSPSYTENYLGRKSFDFSESDIRQLNDVAVLRKFGFSISEIQEMMQHPENIIPITKDLQSRKQAKINEEKELLLVLNRLDANGIDTVTALAACLSAPVLENPLPAEDQKWNIPGMVFAALKTMALFTITWIPVILAIFILMRQVNEFHYPVFFPFAMVMTAISLLPSFFLLLLPRVKGKTDWKPIAKKILLVLCVFSIPVSAVMSFGIVTHSETRDFGHYLDLDPDCMANRSDLFHALFPQWPHYFLNQKQPDGSWETVYLDAHYYYQYSLGWDYTYDIYAEWPLEEEEFEEEVSRVKAVFEEYAPPEEDRSAHHDYLTLQKGCYTCLVIYTGTMPFEEATTSYTYCIFAYDEQSRRVRYIYCDSLDDGYDQPYYLTLEWD